MRITRATRISRVRPVLSVTVAGALLLSGCGGGEEPAARTPGSTSSSTNGTSSEPGNTADIEFATGMIPHHGQAIEMAAMATTKAGSAKVKDLARKISAAQAPEITALSGLLSSWGEPVPDAGGHSGSMAGMDHGDTGMMTSRQMDDLRSADGAEFDRMWLDMMIAHHEGAVTMSRAEVADGADARAKQLAQAVIEAQTKEIAELKSLRTDLS